MTDKERERDKQLIANLEKETSEQADQIERLAALAQSDTKPPREVYDKVKGHAVTQSGDYIPRGGAGNGA